MVSTAMLGFLLPLHPHTPMEFEYVHSSNMRLAFEGILQRNKGTTLTPQDLWDLLETEIKSEFLALAIEELGVLEQRNFFIKSDPGRPDGYRWITGGE
ncbi:MAG: hypothetical protein ACPGVO_04435 [Spirulinaceae cyanobacterium]